MSNREGHGDRLRFRKASTGRSEASGNFIDGAILVALIPQGLNYRLDVLGQDTQQVSWSCTVL